MLRKGQEGHVRAERDLLKSAALVSSPGMAEWIVRLHYSFQDRDNLYLVRVSLPLSPFAHHGRRSWSTWAAVTCSISSSNAISLGRTLPSFTWPRLVTSSLLFPTYHMCPDDSRHRVLPQAWIHPPRHQAGCQSPPSNLSTTSDSHYVSRISSSIPTATSN